MSASRRHQSESRLRKRLLPALAGAVVLMQLVTFYQGWVSHDGPAAHHHTWQAHLPDFFVLGAVGLAFLAGGYFLLGRLERAMDQRSASLEQAKQQAEAASRSKSAFLANMSHEIRTPMTAILGFADVLAEDSDFKANQREAIQTIQSSAAHLLTVISDIMDVSEIEAGQVSTEPTATDPVEILEAVAAQAGPEAKRKGIAFEIRYDSEMPDMIESEPERLQQILLNLVNHAVKSTEAGRVDIAVSCEVPAQRMTFTITDTGVGMSPEQVDAITRFETFSQTNINSVRLSGETGLGLRIAKALAKMLGGGLAVQSQEGQGSSFTVTISTGNIADAALIDPSYLQALRAARAQAERDAQQQRPTDVSLAGLHILLAEDGPDNQRLIKHHLTKAGATVTVCENGQVAVETMKSLPPADQPDVVLMDMQMPELDGYGATRLLRQRHCQVPILALTAHAMEGDRKKCLRAGCDDYLTKPINKAVLLEACASWASHTRRTSASEAA